MTYIKNAVNTTIAWPVDKVILEKITEMIADNAASTPSVKIKVLFVQYHHYKLYV